MSRSAPSPRLFQLYSPRRPSPLGLPPLVPHTAFQDVPNSSYPKTPERYYCQPSDATGFMRFPPEARRPLAGGTQRSRAPPPAPLSLDTQHHPAVVQLPTAGPGGGRSSYGQTLQPPATEEMRVPPSPTPSSTSSLSLYSAESLKKSFSIGVIQEEEEEEGRKGGGGFCACFNFKALFGTKSKPSKILTPRERPATEEPAPAPQMVQTRRRPPPLVILPINQ